MTHSPSKSLHAGPYAGLTVNSAKRFLMAQFRDAGIDTAEIDARLLLMVAANLTHSDIIMRGTDNLTGEALERVSEYSARRLSGEPVDHILGRREFYGRDFRVTKDVLSPRPETEMLIDAALEIIKFKPEARLLDLGTGSGAIIISILAEAKNTTGVAVDLSEAALAVAAENAAQHDVAGRLTLRRGSWFDPVSGRFDIILSNPPYITDAAMKNLGREVKNYDPDLALRGGEDGLAAYREIISQAPHHLTAGGFLLLEIGYDQGASVSALLLEAGYAEISVHKDISGHDRMIKAAF